MTGDFAKLIAALFVFAGSGFTLLAAIGILRLPDLYTRMHAASKAGSVGAAMTLIALAFVASDTAEMLRAIAAVVFILLTAPVSAHLLAKAAHGARYQLWQGSVRDDMAQAAKTLAEDRPK